MGKIITRVNGRVTVKMNQICGCSLCVEGWTLDDCEEKCPLYYSCDNVAIANDILSEDELQNARWYTQEFIKPIENLEKENDYHDED